MVVPRPWSMFDLTWERQAEAEVFPCLRMLGMKFYAHGPLFAGVLRHGRWRYFHAPLFVLYE